MYVLTKSSAGDLDQQHELELGDTATVGRLIALCASTLQDQPQQFTALLEMLTAVINGQVQSISFEGEGFINGVFGANAEDTELMDSDDLPLDKLVPALAKILARHKQKQAQSRDPSAKTKAADRSLRPDGLPRQIVR